MNINFQINFNGSPDQEDIRAARQTIFVENQRLAALNPPETLLSTATPADTKASYISLLIASVTDLHNQNILNSKTRAITTRLTDAQMKQVYCNIIDLLNNGMLVDDVIAKIA